MSRRPRRHHAALDAAPGRVRAPARNAAPGSLPPRLGRAEGGVDDRPHLARAVVVGRAREDPCPGEDDAILHEDAVGLVRVRRHLDLAADRAPARLEQRDERRVLGRSRGVERREAST